MFHLTDTPTFEAEVRFESQAAQGGQRVVHAFTGVFNRLDEDASEALAKEIRTQKLTDRQVAARLLCGWGADVCDAQGRPLPFNADNLAAVLRRRGVATAVVDAWHQAQPRAALGN